MNMREEQSPGLAEDKRGEALNAERFRMLEDIAREPAGEVVFPPTSTPLCVCAMIFRIRRCLRARIAKIVSIEPLIAAKLMQLAVRSCIARTVRRAKDLSAAISRWALIWCVPLPWRSL
ncbi:MAG: hypothetical protein IPI89_09015 [Propionivibrio sp.]|nr:hypothetical protein [Propionivibrio sp.]